MIDLHCHTKYSDGSNSLEEVIKLAKRLGIKQLAITDHNVFYGAIIAHWLEPDLILTGIELSVGYTNNEELHLLGYFPKATDFSNVMNVIKQSEARKSLAVMEMVERLNDMGYEISVSELSNFAAGTINRVHICQALIKHGYIKTIDEGFKNIIGEHCPAYVPREYVPIEEAAEAIHEDGGIAILAHPYNYKDVKDIPKLLDDVIDCVDGIECFHPTTSEENSKYLVDYVTKHNKRITGGSDFHGENKTNIFLGMMNVDDKYMIK